MNCPNCNTPIDGQVEFCPNCGQKVTDTAAVLSTEQPVNAQQNQPERKRDGLFVSSIVFLVLGIVCAWIPVMGITFCILSLVFAIIAKKRTGNKSKGAKVCFVLSIVFIAISVLMTVLIIVSLIGSSSPSFKAEQFALEEIKNQFGSYNEYKGHSLDSKVSENDENTYIITGSITYESNNYSKKQVEVYKIAVDCKVRHDPATGSFTMIENKSTETLKEAKALPSASSKINDKKAMQFAEEEFKKRVKFKNESSYVRNDYSVTSSYNINGSITVTVLLDFSAQNSFGGMTRSVYKITLQYSNGEYTFKDYSEVK